MIWFKKVALVCKLLNAFPVETTHPPKTVLDSKILESLASWNFSQFI